jgi:gas vesicle protein
MSGKKGGLLFGVIMGTLMGLLFAPGKGKEIRRRILKEIDEGGLGTKTLGSNIKLMGRDIVDTAQDAYANPDLQKNVNRGRKGLGRFIAELKRKVTDKLTGKKHGA